MLDAVLCVGSGIFGHLRRSTSVVRLVRALEFVEKTLDPPNTQCLWRAHVLQLPLEQALQCCTRYLVHLALTGRDWHVFSLARLFAGGNADTGQRPAKSDREDVC